MGDQDNKELIQGYIDKIYHALIETGKTINRVLLLLTFFSFTIIALSIGIARACCHSFGQNLGN